MKKELAHYFVKRPKGELRLRKIRARLRGKEFEFFTGAGVFSPKRIDRGTQLLTDKSRIKQGWTVLDLGCGYGPVGIALKNSFPSLTVVMTDINKRAVSLARMNAKLNNVKVDIRQGQLYGPVAEKKFDAILVNPPQTAGKALCFEMIEGAKERLLPGGELQLVARHRIGGKSFEAKMLEVFGNVDTVAKKGGFRIYVSKNTR